jgi:ribosomal protein S18 acetylase RimI-like enzyme
MATSSIEIVDLRHLLPAAMEELLADEGHVWERELLWDYSSTAGMIRRFLEGRALAGYAAVENRQATGFTFYVYEAGKGLIGDLFVRPDFRRDAVYFKLLTSTLETLEATPGIRRVEAQLLHADTAAVRGLFASRGYICHDRSFLKLDLRNAPPAVDATSNPPPAFQIVDWEASRFLDSANLITRAYAGHIDCEVSDQYRTQSGALRFLDNIIHYPGCGEFFPAASLLGYPADRIGAPCGMILTSVVSPGVAHITQLCVAPECQGQKLGKTLLEHALAKLAERGFHTVTLTATDANEAAMKLYRRTGFTTMLRFPAFVWENNWAGASLPKAPPNRP